MDAIWRAVLDGCRERPVLLDLGASAGAPAAWNTIASSCVYVGFEPDPRSTDTVSSGFAQTIIVRAAATDVEAPTVPMHLTRSRFCSSTLPPDAISLEKFVFADLFEIDRIEEVPATTLTLALRSHGVRRVQWFKADTQGTDLRLFQSLEDAVRTRVLAVDLEPGLINAYHGEDFFVDVHAYMTAHGFWLSSMNVGTNTRGSRAMCERVFGRAVAADAVPAKYRQTPVCCEARYLRELDSAALDGDDLAALATFAAMDHQPLFALEAIEAIGATDRGEAVQQLWDACVTAVRPAPAAPGGLLSRVRRRLA
jgi:FkbM family methyltransferase